MFAHFGRWRCSATRIGSPVYSPLPGWRLLSSTAAGNEAKVTPFQQLKLLGPLRRYFDRQGFESPTAVQAEFIPVLLKGFSAFISSHTGSGKTAAFGLPLLQRLQDTLALRGDHRPIPAEREANTVYPLLCVIAPTQSLAIQQGQMLSAMAAELPLISVHVADIRSANSRIPADLNVLVGTPANLLKMTRFNLLNCAHVDAVVLDEVDKLLSSAHVSETDRIWQNIVCDRRDWQRTNSPVQVVGVSATVQEAHVEALQAAAVSVAAPWHSPLKTRREDNWQQADKEDAQNSAPLQPAQQYLLPPTLEHIFYEVPEAKKIALLGYLARRKKGVCAKPARILCFVKSRHRCERVAETLRERYGVAASVYHGLRQDALPSSPSSGSAVEDSILPKAPEPADPINQPRLWIATDILARGMDLPLLDVVVMLDCPLDTNGYVHRAGRAGRSGRRGHVISFVADGPVPVEVRGVATERNDAHVYGSIVREIWPQSALRLQKIPGPWRGSDDEGSTHTHNHTNANTKRQHSLRHWRGGRYEDVLVAKERRRTLAEAHASPKVPSLLRQWLRQEGKRVL